MPIDIFVYEDVDTGIKYLYDGTKLVPLVNPNKSNDNKNNIDLSKVDEDTLEEEEKERQEQIEKELEELSDMDANSPEAESKAEDITSLFDDEELGKDLMAETDKIVGRDRKKRAAEKKKAEAAAKQFSATATLDGFKIDIHRLIAKEVKAIRSTSWNKINKKYSTTKIIKPGYKEKENGHIPKLFVYFDQSGSWSASDVEVGKQAIKVLDEFVEKDQLKIELYYFANNIHTDVDRAREEAGTHAGAKLIQHIASNKPDNVVILTDADFDRLGEIDEATPTRVQGGVFLLFKKNSVSNKLVNKLSGRLFKKIYMFN